MPSFMKRLLLFLISVGVLAAPLLIWFGSDSRRDDALDVLDKYLTVLYVRDFRQAYNYISAADRELKSRAEYVRERGAFEGVALDAARKLSDLIETQPVDQQVDGSLNRITVALKLPDANAVSELLLGWDESRLNSLPASQQKKLLANVEELVRQRQVPMIEGEEKFVLIREGSQWKIFLDWASGVQVKFATTLPPQSAIEAEPVTKETVLRSGDVFTVGFKVKNAGTHEIVTRIVHRVDPDAMSQYLELVECALLLPVRLRPGEEQIFNSTYVIRGDLPDDAKSIAVNYDFQVQN
jgi:hypothetical protein